MIYDNFTTTIVTTPTAMVFTPVGVLYAALFSLLILFFILIPYIIELRSAYALARKRDEQAQEILKSSIKDYIDSLKAQNCPLTDEQLDRFYERVFAPIQETLKQPVSGVTGSTRGIIAFAVIFIVGISAMLIMFATGGDPQIVNNVISMLAATLATIVGFYFGGRGAQDAIDRAEKAKAAAAPQPPAAQEKSVKPAPPVLKVKGIKIGATKKNESGIVTMIKDVDIFGFWDTYDKETLDYSMDPNTDYSLYCNVESSVPEGSYDIYIEPVLKKEFESKPFLYELRETYQKMIPHSKVNTWYVKDFEWFPKYQNWRAAGEYRVVLRFGYLKKGTQLGTAPNWLGTEEFTVKLT
jgi:hypothetical protein